MPRCAAGARTPEYGAAERKPARPVSRRITNLSEPGSNPVEEDILSRENEIRLQQAVDQLPPRQKQIFTLSRHKGLKHEEIADKLQISRHTVKTHLVQALKTLRSVLFYR